LKIKNQISLHKVKEAAIEKSKLQKSNHFIESPSNGFKKKFDAIMDEVSDNTNISIEEISAKMLMSVSTFERWMKKIYGTSPRKYILSYKLSKAEIMLRQNLGSVKDIAYLLGFNSVSYFCSSFKEKYGKSPLNYIKS
jgi:AraC-like DNA-binding protein